MQNNKNFICPRCFKTFDRKSNFARHIHRVTSCSKDINFKDFTDSQKDKLKNYIIKKYPKLSNELIDDIVGENLKNYDIKKYFCDFCGKSFKSSSYFKRHQRELCPKHLRFEQHTIIDRIKKIEKLKQDNQELKEKIYYTMKTLPRYYIEEGKLVNVEKNYINFYEQKNIKFFGYEILDHVTDKFMKRMVMNPEIGLINLIKEIHFNPEINQNRNMFVKSRKFNHVEVYKKGGWKTLLKKDVFQDLITTKKDLMDEFFDKFKEGNEIKDKYIFKYETFSNCLDKYISHLVFGTEYDSSMKKEKLVYERICKMITLLFLNNQKIEVTYTPEQNINTSEIGEEQDIVKRVQILLEQTEQDVQEIIENIKDDDEEVLIEGLDDDEEDLTNESENSIDEIEENIIEIIK